MFTYRNDAVADIITTIESGNWVTDARAEYDIEAIANAILGDSTTGYAQTVDADEFWTIVEANAR